MHRLRYISRLVRLEALPRFSRLALHAAADDDDDDDESRRRCDDGRMAREKGKDAVGRIHRRGAKKKDTTTRERAAEGVEKCQPANWKRGWQAGRRTGDSLRQPRRQINMSGRAISNIRRSRRIGASRRVSYGDDVRPQDASGTHSHGPLQLQVLTAK